MSVIPAIAVSQSPAFSGPPSIIVESNKRVRSAKATLLLKSAPSARHLQVSVRHVASGKVDEVSLLLVPGVPA